jgi:putative membrane protein
MPALDELPRLLWGSLTLRPYVFALLGLYLAAAIAAWGWRRAAVFTGLAGGLAFAAEASSTRTGVPFGLYHYTQNTRGQELYLADVPFFDPLSFTFLAYASLGLARHLLARWPKQGGRTAEALGAGVVMMWLDIVIDPLAVRGDRWFLGRIFYYPEPGPYFGVPLANFAGWAALGTAIAAVWRVVEPRVPGAAPAWAAALPGRACHALWLYYLVLAFNLALTAAVAEAALFWAGVAAHVPLALLVVSSVSTSAPRGIDGRPG